MTSPATKANLLQELNSARSALLDAISGLTDAQLAQPGVEGDWSVCDLIAHLTFWEGRAVFLLESALNGYQSEYNQWKDATIDSLNERNYKANRGRPAYDLQAASEASFMRLIDLVNRIPENDLFAPEQFDWIDGEPLIEHITGETYEHTQEHLPALQAWRAKLGP